MAEPALELPAKDQFLRAVAGLESAVNLELEQEKDVSAQAAASFLDLLGTIPGITLSPEERASLQEDSIYSVGMGSFELADAFEIRDLFGSGALGATLYRSGDVETSVAVTLPDRVSKDGLMVIAIRKFSGIRGAELRLLLSKNARYLGGTFLTGTKSVVDGGMSIEGKINFDPNGGLKEIGGHRGIKTHGVKRINTARIASALLDHSSSELRPHQILVDASI